MSETATWSPHPMRMPGRYLIGLLQLGLGIALLLAAREGRLPSGALGDAAAGIFLTFALALGLLPSGSRGPRIVSLILIAALALLLQILAHGPLASTASRLGLAVPGAVPGVVLAAAGLALLIAGELRRRRVRLRLEPDRVVVAAPRWGIEHTLPLDTVREVNAHRRAGGRIWGYGDLVARVRTATMKDHITRPVVAEAPPNDVLLGCGWDEEERFHLVAAHPYARVARLLEERVRVARLAPAERQETELATRLAEDLEGIEV